MVEAMNTLKSENQKLRAFIDGMREQLIIGGVSLRKKGKVRWFDCECGKKFSVTTNIYDNSDSGCGSCECGKSRVYIN